MTIKINYIGVHQPQETVEVDEEKAKILVKGDYEYATKTDPAQSNRDESSRPIFDKTEKGKKKKGKQSDT